MSNLPGSIKRPGGPRTPKGKTAAAYNALRTGVYSRSAFLDGEDEQEFEAIKQALFDNLAPQTVVQYALADDVLKQLWRKFRLERYESATLRQISERELAMTELIVDLGLDASQIVSSAQRLSESVRKNGLDYYKGLQRRVQAVQHLYPKHCADLVAFKRDHPDLYQLMRKLSWRPDSLDNLITKNDADSSGKIFWEHELKSLEDWAKDWIYCFDCEEKLNKAIPRIKNNRIYRHLISGDVDRATDDVTRALHRGLAEHYKERDRYRKDCEVALDAETEDTRERYGDAQEEGEAGMAEADSV